MVGFVLLLAAFLIVAICTIWLIIIAFKESTSRGLLSLFVPYFVIYYGVTRWKKTKRIFAISATALIFFIAGLVVPPMLWKSEVTPVIEGFMQAGATNNIEKAHTYWIFYTRIDTVARIIREHDDVFVGFESFTTSSIDMKGDSGSLIGWTEGWINGELHFGNGNSTDFGIMLVKHNNAWWINDIVIGENLHVPY